MPSPPGDSQPVPATLTGRGHSYHGVQPDATNTDDPLAHIHLFARLESTERAELFGAMTREKVAANQTIFWHDPALYGAVYEVLRAPVFALDHGGAVDMLERCFGRETAALHASHKTHRTAVESYKAYLADLSYVSGHNKDMRRMSASDIPGYLARARPALAAFRRARV